MKFDTIVEALISKFKPSNGDTVAILPGGFKPPHKGHFNALNYLLDEADRGIVFVGKGERDGINADQSKQIWDIYKKHLRKPVDIIIAEKTPVMSTYEYADAHPNQNIIVGAGPEDEKRFSFFKKNIDKYPLVKIINIPPMYNRISGTAIRQQICKRDKKAVDCFTPTDTRDGTEIDLLTPKEKKKIEQILKF
jgi:nicotinamide mononucleotide adenylyltransferase